MKRNLLLFLFILISFTSFSQCTDGQVEVTFTIYTDAWAYENYWQLVPSGAPCGNDVIAEGANLNVGCAGTAADNSPEGYDNDAIVEVGPFCLTDAAYYDLIFVDSYGDGGLVFQVFENGILTHQYFGTDAGNTWTFQIGNSDIPENNMPCNAYEIIPNTFGIEMNNENAIVGVGEVAPNGGGCSTPGLWCENDLVHTVWAYFVAEENVTYEITTCGDWEGFDTQLALWHATDCGDFSTFELVAANDDMIGGCATSNGFSSLMHAGCLIPGDLYYVQLDGWNGATGTTSITVSSYEGEVSFAANEQDVPCPVNKGEEGYGSIFPYVIGSGANFSAEWTGPNNFTSQETSLIDILPGTYNLTLTTTCGEVFTETFEITEPQFWNVFLTTTQPTCPESGNGELLANVGGATEPFEFNWTGPSNFVSESAVASNLDAGSYLLIITDDNGCTYDLNYTLNASNTFELDLGPSVILCSNEIYTLSPNTEYTYEWFDGSNEASIQIDATQWGIGDHSIFATATTSDGCTDVDTFNFTVDGCVSVEEVGAPLVTQMYPQPSQGNISFVFKQKLDFGKIYIYDAAGRIVLEQGDIQSTHVVLNTTLAAGRYTVRVSDGAQYFVAPLVIVR